MRATSAPKAKTRAKLMRDIIIDDRPEFYGHKAINNLF